MAITTTHPLYAEYDKDWELCRDSFDITPIKKKRDVYLPATSGHIIDGFGKEGSLGEKSYKAYLTRAYYPDIFREAVAAAIGVMHRKPPIIELPSALEPLRLKSTKIGESLEMLLRRINTEQLVTGRVGALLDLSTDAGTNITQPYIVLYNELAVRNWDDTEEAQDTSAFRMVVLDETGYELTDDLSWETKERYLVLNLVTPNGEGWTITNNTKGFYAFAKAESTSAISDLTFTPAEYRGTRLEEIPFVTINSSDISPSPDNPPLLGLAELCLLIYRGEADYRQNLFMQGQDTFVTIGGRVEEGTEVRTGAGARVDLPMGGDAKYVGVNSQGLPEQRSALENDYKRAYSKSGQISDSTSRAKESGDALRIRVAAQTATLPQIAMAGAAGLEKLLKTAALWVGANPEEVKITPNLEFTNDEGNAETLLKLVQAKVQGVKLSDESIHAYAREQKFTTLSYEDEIAKIESEVPTL